MQELTSAMRGRSELPPEMGQRVPVLADGAGYLLQLLSDDDIAFDVLVAEIERFPPIVARLLALANSAWSAPVAPVTSLVTACSRLGLKAVRSAALALAVADPFDPTVCPAFDPRRYWSSALLTAEAAGLLAEGAVQTDAQSARAAGLLRNIGLLWLADSMPGPTGRALERAAEEPGAVLEVLLRESCGLDQLEAGRILAAYWDLPSVFVDAAYLDRSVVATARAGLPLAVLGGAALASVVRAEGDGEIAVALPGVPAEETAAVQGAVARERQRLEELAEQLCA
ncbi:MAG: HDOD domain-containing protein [Gammaproteobacteria bacterium]|nr:MAG: HDOD domain-containing protein [Gammaproteobacteria bacterium]